MSFFRFPASHTSRITLSQKMGRSLRTCSVCRLRGRRKEHDDDFYVLADGTVVGRIFHAAASPVGSPWMWTLAFGHHEDRTPTHAYAATREAAMAAFAKSWRRG